MIVSIQLLKDAKHLNKECQESLQAILQARAIIKETEPKVIQNIFTEEIEILITKDIDNSVTIQKNVANLIGQYSSNVGDDMKEVLKNSDEKKKKTLKRELTSSKSDMKKMCADIWRFEQKSNDPVDWIVGNKDLR